MKNNSTKIISLDNKFGHDQRLVLIQGTENGEWECCPRNLLNGESIT